MTTTRDQVTAMRALLVEIREELADRVDGAPDSRTRWMWSLMTDIDSALEVQPNDVCVRCGEFHVWHGRDDADRACPSCRSEG